MGGMRCSGETERHRELKRLAKEWLRGRGCDAVAGEVRLPYSPYRADAAGYRPAGGFGERVGETFAVECKQSRADFLRDSADALGCAAVLASERCRRAKLRELMAGHLPECRTGESLFPEFDRYDFSRVRHDGLRRVERRIRILERKRSEGSKFSRMVHYGCATFCYLAVEADARPRGDELPEGWGLLVRSGDRLEVERVAEWVGSPENGRLKLLSRIMARAERDPAESLTYAR